jgi:hypoxanthine phosphoribosyltransferase
MKIIKIINNRIFKTILIISIYIYFIQNLLEKTLSNLYLNYNIVKKHCEFCENSSEFNICLGFPSEYSETSTVFFSLLYLYKFINFNYCIFFILVFSIFSIILYKGTLFQVIVGIIFGLFYTQIFYLNKLSYKSFVIVFLIGLIFVILSVNKIDKIIHEPVPDWIDEKMYKTIKEKQDKPFIFKFAAFFSLCFFNINIITWNKLEKYLDIIIDKIKEKNIKFDCIVGIKSGGAIISDYISKKLNITNYKIKLIKKEYNCKKTSNQSILDVFYKYFLKLPGNYDVCEKITDNLEYKKVILIDEQIFSGETIKESINYLKNDKHAEYIYPITIFNLNPKSTTIDYIFSDKFPNFPWGYDN